MGISRGHHMIFGWLVTALYSNAVTHSTKRFNKNNITAAHKVSLLNMRNKPTEYAKFRFNTVLQKGKSITTRKRLHSMIH